MLKNIDKIHTTSLGLIRLNKNIGINDIEYYKKIITDPKSIITKKGKNYYIENNNIIITVNSYSYTIITARRNKL